VYNVIVELSITAVVVLRFPLSLGRELLLVSCFEHYNSIPCVDCLH